MIIESSFIPFPSEIVIPPAAYMAASGGDMHLGLVVLFGTLGALIGALINYWLAVLLGRSIVYRIASGRVGALLLLDPQKVAKAERFFVKYGAVATFTGRLIPGIRQLISIPGGLARMPISTFLAYTTLGAGLWNLVLALIGYYLAGVVPPEELNAYVSRYSHEIGLGVVAVVVVALGVVLYKASRRRRVDLVDTDHDTEE